MNKLHILIMLFVLCLLSSLNGNTIDITLENDGFVKPNPTDRWYTNGFSFKYSFPSEVNLITKLLSLGRNVDNTNSSYIFEAAQNMYTPSIINPSAYTGIQNPNYNDRPYAGWTRLGLSLYANYEDEYINSGFTFGDLGEAGAGFTQTLIHQALKCVLPEGWKYHIKERIAYQFHYSWQKEISQQYIDDTKVNKWFSIIPFTDLELGNVFIRATGGGQFRLGIFSNSVLYQASSLIPSGKTDAIPIEFSFFLEPSITATAYNGTLDHQADSNYNNITSIPIRFEFSLGVSILLFKAFGIEGNFFTLRTPDFAVNNHLPVDFLGNQGFWQIFTHLRFVIVF